MGLALPPFLMGTNHGNTGINTNTAQQSSSESEDWEEESWTVDCPCGVTFDDGEEMISCDECDVWVHTACCKVSKSVETYVCDKCKEKKRKEHEESEVAQLLAEFPGKSVSFDDRNFERTDMLLGDMGMERRRIHEQGIPGGDPAIYLSMSGVFSRQLWKSVGYVPKVLQLKYQEIPEIYLDASNEPSVFDTCTSALKDSPSKHVKKVKVEPQEVKVSNGDVDVQKLKVSVDDRHGKKLESARYAKHKQKLRGSKDEKPQQSQSKRFREDVKDPTCRKKMKTSPDAFKGDNPKKLSLQQSSPKSPKNPKAMKKSAGEEFMEVDTRVCSRCSKPEPVPNNEQASSSKPLVCQECQKPRLAVKKQDNRVETEEGASDQSRKYPSEIVNIDRTISQSETASTELPRQFQTMECAEPEKKAHEGESIDQSFSHQSSRQQKPAGMKPPDDVTSLQRRSGTEASVEHKAHPGCQLSVKTNSFPKSEIPSPASINSAGAAKDFPLKSLSSSPIHQKPAVRVPHLPPVAIAKPGTKPVASSKSSSSKQASAVPSFKKSDVKSPSATQSSNAITRASQPCSTKQLTCKTSSLKAGQVVKKQPSSTLKSRDAGDKGKDEKATGRKTTSPSAGAPAAAAPLNDEELALLLHQELNSSPRVPRVPRVRQGTAASGTGQQSSVLTKRALGNAAQKEHRLMWRTRHKEGKHGETHVSKRHEERTDDEAASSRAESDASEGVNEVGSSAKKAAESEKGAEGGGDRTHSSEPGGGSRCRGSDNQPEEPVNPCNEGNSRGQLSFSKCLRSRAGWDDLETKLDEENTSTGSEDDAASNYSEEDEELAARRGR